MLRAFNPTDLLGLAVLQARSPRNFARGWDTLANGDGHLVPLGALVGEWLPGRAGRHAWVLSHRGFAIGVVSLRRRRAPSAWEVDRLQLASGQEGACIAALEGLGLTAGRIGAERLFLRLPEGSPIERSAIESGFSPLVREQLCIRPQAPRRAAAVQGLRPARPEDHVNLLHLYHAVVPAPVRTVDGGALSCWGAVGPSRPAHQQTMVVEKSGELVGALAVSEADCREAIDLLARTGDACAAEAIAEAAAMAYGGKRSLLCLLPEYGWWMVPSLEREGFRRLGVFNLFVKEIVARARRPRLLPVGA